MGTRVRLPLRRSESILDFSARWESAMADPAAFNADACGNDVEQMKYFECLLI